MNKIYKVIFNKTKGVYEVVSELAHCHSKIHSKKAALARIMAVFMGLSSFMGYTMNVVYATDTYKYLNGTLDDLKNGTFPLLMLMYGKEASNRKQEIDRQHYTIPNQRPKDKHCGKI